MSVKCAADTARNTADDKWLLERQQDTVNGRLSNAENTGNEVRDRHFFQLLVLGLEENSENHRRSSERACKERHHHVIIAQRHDIVDVNRNKAPVHAKNNKDLPRQTDDGSCNQRAEATDGQSELGNEGRTEGCHRAEHQQRDGQSNQQREHRHKEELDQLGHNPVEELLTLGCKPDRQNNRNDRSSVIHRNHREP